ncbi:tRNA pseudouridine(55) synthase TruB [Marinilabiliaceae bacterium JC017]|nr:tRNA pseudouridine(55) synthase TruB [Marinilabiliaceae bacterium JC017]
MKELSSEDFIKGQVLLVNKPLTWTSFDIVNKIRSSLKYNLGIKKIKVGHAGTLDPLATGLVIVCTGKATKQIDQFLGLDKTYVATVKFGGTTPSYDAETEIDGTFPYDHITREKLDDAISLLSGEIEQVPPLFSAIKVNGRKAYDLARKGEKVTLKARKVMIFKVEVLSFDLPVVKLKIHCSKGTYIRSYAHDLGKALNSGGYLTALERTNIGEYQVEDALEIGDFEKIFQQK